MGRYMFCATAAKQNTVRRGQKNQTCFRRSSAFKKYLSPSHSKKHRADVMMDSLADDQIRHKTDSIDEAKTVSRY